MPAENERKSFIGTKCTLVMLSHYLEQVERVADNVGELTDKRLLFIKGRGQ